MRERAQMIYVFCLVDKNYRRVLPYIVPNKVSKMTVDKYIEIFEELGGDLKGITLWQDKDLAHNSKKVMAYCKKKGLAVITSPSNSLLRSLYNRDYGPSY